MSLDDTMEWWWGLFDVWVWVKLTRWVVGWFSLGLLVYNNEGGGWLAFQSKPSREGGRLV